MPGLLFHANVLRMWLRAVPGPLVVALHGVVEQSVQLGEVLLEDGALGVAEGVLLMRVADGMRRLTFLQTMAGALVGLMLPAEVLGAGAVLVEPVAEAVKELPMLVLNGHDGAFVKWQRVEVTLLGEDEEVVTRREADAREYKPGRYVVDFLTPECHGRVIVRPAFAGG